MLRRSHWIWGFVLVGAVGCGSAPAGTPDARPDGAPAGGTVVMVHGTNLGMIDVDGNGMPDGVGYDSDGDGRADEIDLDGDGVSDGEDLDGDGVITVWSHLGTGELPPTPAMVEQQIRQTDPDFDQRLDPMHPPASAAPGTGEVTPPAMLVLPEFDMNTLRPQNQGQQGSCAGFAVAGAATIVRHRREMGTASNLWASPGFIYSRMVPATMTTCGMGTYISTGLDTLVREGSASLTELPLIAGDNPIMCDPMTSSPTQHVFRIGGYQALRPLNRATVREALAAGSAVVFGVGLTQNFFQWRGDAARQGTFRLEGDCTGSQHCGGHAMVIVGYDDARSAFRVLNSWGTDWGDRGYLWWDYASLEGGSGLHGYVITPLPDAPQALAAPDPSGFSVNLVGGTVLTRRVNPMDMSMTFEIGMRLQLSEPARITAITIVPPNSGGFRANMNQWLAYGDVAAWVGTTMPEQGMAPATITAELRNGMSVERQIMITIPAPEANATGQN